MSPMKNKLKPLNIQISVVWPLCIQEIVIFKIMFLYSAYVRGQFFCFSVLIYNLLPSGKLIFLLYLKFIS